MWSRHPSRESLLALVEERGSARDRDHVERCERCRRDVVVWRASLVAVRDVEVPEPSPLFWDHLSARIGEAVAAEPVPVVAAAGLRLLSWRAGLWMTATAVAVALAVAVTWRPSGRAVQPAASTGAAQPGWSADTAALDTADAEWEFLLTLAGAAEEGPSGDLIEGMHPGMADRALLALSGSERTALVELLETELRQPNS